jgi:hypothetical protein
MRQFQAILPFERGRHERKRCALHFVVVARESRITRIEALNV